ncbi:hypothetical protein HPB47_010837 [Ixodes persulcatus]|uniref:Uncharacterized protein n=1 Tax=Ixodes persulcatus TaxID=34615 RepID=A0AC60NY10_IXOPE|nr:hypothetical protein HPB47_010837 [Ixodes persulcatus]
MKNPKESHVCSNPKCSLCGGNHLTANKECKAARFKTPYVVRKRRWERQQREEEGQQQQQRPRGPAWRQTTWQASDGRRGRSQTRRGRSRSATGSPSAAGACRRESRSRSKSMTRRSNGAEKQVGCAAGSSAALNNSNFTPLRSPSPSKDKECRHCLELKQMIERQSNQIKSKNKQIEAMMERIEALSRATNNGNDDSVAKRKVAKRDTTCAAPAAPKPITPPGLITPPTLTQSETEAPKIETAVVAMEEEKAEAAVPPTMETVMSMLTQTSNQVSQLSEQRWETLLTSPVLEDQLVLISRGRAAREAYGSRDEGTTSIDGVEGGDVILEDDVKDDVWDDLKGDL